MTTVHESRDDRPSVTDTIAGLLAVGSIVLSGIAMGLGLLLQLDAHPARVSPVALVGSARRGADELALPVTRPQGRAVRGARLGDRDDDRGDHRGPAVLNCPQAGIRRADSCRGIPAFGGAHP